MERHSARAPSRRSDVARWLHCPRWHRLLED